MHYGVPDIWFTPGKRSTHVMALSGCQPAAGTVLIVGSAERAAPPGGAIIPAAASAPGGWRRLSCPGWIVGASEG